MLWDNRIGKFSSIFTPVFLLIFTISCSLISKSRNAHHIKINSLEAEEIADDFLKNQEWCDQYIIESAEVQSTKGNAQSWSVTFKHKNWNNQKPGYGLIVVNGITGEASWVPLR